jgi:Sulfatase
MKLGRTLSLLATVGLQPSRSPSRAIAQEAMPNIVVIMGDDIGWENIGAHHRGVMDDTTPNLDKLAAEGMRFTHYYADPSCTAGRANFITVNRQFAPASSRSDRPERR